MSQSVRGFFRKRPGYATWREKPDETTLDKHNNYVSQYGYWLHPTKGYRRSSAIRTVCSNIAESIKSGIKIPFTQMKKDIANARKTDMKTMGDNILRIGRL